MNLEKQILESFWDLKERKEWSVRQASREIDISYGHFSDIFSNRKRASALILQRMVAVYQKFANR